MYGLIFELSIRSEIAARHQQPLVSQWQQQQQPNSQSQTVPQQQQQQQQQQRKSPSSSLLLSLAARSRTAKAAMAAGDADGSGNTMSSTANSTPLQRMFFAIKSRRGTVHSHAPRQRRRRRHNPPPLCRAGPARVRPGFKRCGCLDNEATAAAEEAAAPILTRSRSMTSSDPLTLLQSAQRNSVLMKQLTAEPAAAVAARAESLLTSRQ